MRTVECIYCKSEMKFIGTKKLQLGETGWFLGDLPNLLAGSMEVEIYTCPTCGKIDFFQLETAKDGIAMTVCPKCGQKHEMDDPKCPFCKFNYYEN